MDAAQLDALITGFQDDEAKTILRRKGFTALVGAEQQPETLDKVRDAESKYKGRVTYLQQAIAALQKLKADGYPAFFDFTFPADVYQDLAADQDAVNAAMQHVKAAPAETEVSGGHIEFTPKPPPA